MSSDIQQNQGAVGAATLVETKPSLKSQVGTTGDTPLLSPIVQPKQSNDVPASVKASWEFMSATDLLNMKLPDTPPIVEGLLSPGLAILGGKPKVGKSWMVLELALAISEGRQFLGHTVPVAGDTLYLALEDGPRRLQRRLQSLLAGRQPPSRLDLTTQRIKPTEARTMVEDWLQNHPNAKLVIIDTLKKVRPHRSGSKNVYDADYEDLAVWKDLADKFNVAILLVHHLSKETYDDPMDMLNGSSALSGAPDTILVLQREKRGKVTASLTVGGRDINDNTFGLKFDPTSGLWTLESDARHVGLPDERAEILTILEEHGGMLTLSDISDRLGLLKDQRNVLEKRLSRMVNDDLLHRPSKGCYSLFPSGQSECQVDLSAIDLSGDETIH